MINRAYLLAMSVAWIDRMPQADLFGHLVCADDLASAQALAAARAGQAAELHDACMWWQVSADMALVRGDVQQAHWAYGRSVRHAAGPFAAFLSGRAAARRALHGQMLSPPALAFWRSPWLGEAWDQGYERLAGCALACHEGAFDGTAVQKTHELRQLALRGGQVAWRLIAQALLLEFDVQERIHQLPEFADHVYWRSGQGAPCARVEREHALAHLPADPTRAPVVRRVLARRAAQLQKMVRATPHMPHAREPDASLLAVTDTGAPPVDVYHCSERVEAAGMALWMRHIRQAEQLLRPLERHEAALQGDLGFSLQCELLYTLSRLHTLQGRAEQGLAMYRRYAGAAMRHARWQQPALRRLAQDTHMTGSAASDDIGARLPAKYRRAYQWMVAHLAEPQISVHDIAAVIGVTERSLQKAFKRHIGDTPMEVIRRLRTEKIHDSRMPDGLREPRMQLAHRLLPASA